MQSDTRTARTRRLVACLAIVGFALYWSASFLVKPKLSDDSGAYSALQLGVQVLTCAIVFAVGLRNRTHVGSQTLVGLCGVFLALGETLSLTLPWVGFWLAPTIVTILLGAGFALLLVLWMSVFSEYESRETCLWLPAAFALGNAVTVCASFFLEGEQSFVVGTIALVCSFGFLVVCSEKREKSALVAHSNDSRQSKGLFDGLLPAFLGAAIFSFVFGIMNEMLVRFGGGSHVLGISSLVITVVLLGGLLAYSYVAQKQIRLEVLFSALLPLMGLAILLNPLLWESASWASDAVVKSCYLLYQCAFWMHLMYALNQTRSKTLSVVSAGAFCIWLPSLLGMLVGNALGFADEQSFMLITIMSMFVLWLCMIGGMLFFKLSKAKEASAAKGVGSDDTAVGFDEGSSGVEGVFEIRTAWFVSRYGLSPREAEVFADFIKGRSAPYIAETLCISEYTVKTHLQHIYTKAKVHNRQELLTLFEEDADLN